MSNSAFCLPFLYRPQILTEKAHYQFETSSHPSSNKASSNCLSQNNPANWSSCKFRSRDITRSSILAYYFGHLCRGIRIQIFGHSDLGFFFFEQPGSILHFYLGVGRFTASAACPSQTGNLEITSKIFAAVICGADEPCSVHTA